MIELALFFLLIAVLIFAFFLYKRASYLEGRLAELYSEKQSQSTRYGHIVEQWLPLSKDFPFNPENFRFIGSPIDGIAFEDDNVFFCEFKFAGSKLTEKEKKIKKLIQEKKVEWCELVVK
ncbi:MAG: Holliday junction resolvase-like protein [Candidatus Diapherotrites archaeon]